MHKSVLFLALFGAAAQARAAVTCSSAVPAYAASAGGFATLDGQIYSPGGTPFIAHGVALNDYQMGSADQLLATFPGLNFVRLAAYSYQPPSAYRVFIDTMTAHGVVVEMQDTTNSTGQDSGGSQGVPYTGQALADQTSWEHANAAAYKGNPYVWFGTDNEPAEPSPAALATWQQQEYQAIRSAGNNNPVMLEVNGWADPASFGQGLPSSVYAQMTNTILDIHQYGWLSGYSTDQSVVDQTLAGDVAAAQANVQGADGTMPVLIGEYGNSTDGMAVDPNGRQVVSAVVNSGYGSTAWAWNPGGAADHLTYGDSALTSFGQQVAGFISKSGSSACPESPIPVPITVAAAVPSIAEVAALGAAGLTSTQANGASPGGDLIALDPNTAAVLAQAPAPVVSPITLTVPSPTGMMPAPAPASGETSFVASSDYQTVVPGTGSDVGTVTGSGNTINATGGVQTIGVSGPGNTLSLGPYNDTVTLSSAGNVVDGGGGNDTVILAYGGGSSVQTNADAAAVSPLASQGNVLVAPAPGTGTMTIQGTLASNDTIDLTKGLAGTTWNHDPATMWNYIDVATTPTGCTISVNGVVVVRLPGGSPSGQLGSFVTAH